MWPAIGAGKAIFVQNIYDEASNCKKWRESDA
jgi:hypothetical protein